MKKKVFFILSSLTAGGSERVFWLLSQSFDRSRYEVYLVLLNTQRSFFSENLIGVNVIDLKTKRASLSFFKLYNLLKREKPYAVYTTGGQINALLGFISLFIHIPFLIARPSNVTEQVKFSGAKSRLLSYVGKLFYKRFNTIVCQSEEIQQSLLKESWINTDKMVIIPNPVPLNTLIKDPNTFSKEKKLIVVARLAKQKGHERLLELFKELPANYFLTIVGDGPLKNVIIEKVKALNLEHRIKVLGLVTNVQELITKHDLFVLPSFVEGFPNAAIEALSVGIPVVSFNTGGISAIIKNNFNGFIVQQNDLNGFKQSIIKACNKQWDSNAIKKDITRRFALENIVERYQELIA